MRTAVYLRQSQDTEGTGLAVERQRQDCLALCATRGWSPTEYVDNHVSATSLKARPAYTRMIADIEAGLVDAVVAWDLDRLHRRPVELESFIDLADRHRLQLATVGGDADLSTDSGRLFARIKGAVARAEIERKSARQKRAAIQLAESGRSWSSCRPFGFLADGTAHHPDEADTVRGLYASLLAGESLSAMARGLNAAGVTTSTGGQWKQSGVSALLRSERYAGIRTYRGEVIGEAAWAPVVDEATFRSALALLRDPTRRTKPATASATHLLTGLALCGVCDDGTTMRATGSGGPRGGIYRCSRAPHLSRRRHLADAWVTDVITLRLSMPSAHLLYADDSRPDVEALRAEAAGYRSRLESLAIDFADGALTATQLRAATERLRAHVTAVEQKMSHAGRAELLSPFVSSTDAEATWRALPLSSRRSILASIATITVHRSTTRNGFDPASITVTTRA